MSNRWEILKEKGNLLFKEGKYEEAISLYSKAIALNNKQEVLFSNRATCQKCLKNYSKSIQDYKRSLEINPNNTKNYYRLSTVYILIGDFKEASLLCEKCISLEPSNQTYLQEKNEISDLEFTYNKIQEKIKNSEFEDAEILSKKLLDKCIGFNELKIIFIKILIENAKYNDALNYINNNQNICINLDKSIYLKALIYYYLTDYDTAKKLINQISNKTKEVQDLENKIRTIPNVKNKANNLFKSQKYEEALNEYSNLMNFDPKNKKFMSTLYANRALCYQKLNKNLEALKDSNLSVKNDPFYPRAYMKRGNVYMALKMPDDAKADFEKAKELDKNTKDVDYYISQANNLQKECKKRDYYKILGIERNADEKDIKRAYKKMAMKFHPDRNCECEETKKIAEKKFIDINDAYTVLSDPKKKQMYDMGCDPLNPEECQGGGAEGMNFTKTDPREIFKMFFGGKNPFEGGDFDIKMGDNNGNSFQTFTFSTNGKDGFKEFKSKGFPGFDGFKGFKGFKGFEGFGANGKNGKGEDDDPFNFFF